MRLQPRSDAMHGLPVSSRLVTVLCKALFVADQVIPTGHSLAFDRAKFACLPHRPVLHGGSDKVAAAWHALGSLRQSRSAA